MKYAATLSVFAASALAAPTAVVQERQAGNCSTATTFPTSVVSKLPDPFTFFSGTKVASLADWDCRQQELNAAIQAQELGTLPPKPTVSATLSGSTLSITSSTGSKSMTFTVSIKKPSGSGPFPAIIAYAAPSLPVPSTVAVITYDNTGMADQTNSGSRGKGKFYDLYGADHSAGAMTAWAWGVARIMDAIELVPTAGIDPKHVGVTGCSRNGKGAFVAGALEPRIALTLPQESGSGGAACWRISDMEKAAGKNIQTSSEIVGENVWFSKTFNNFATKSNTLATDHHELAGLVAPRGLLSIENDIDWLGPVSTTACMKIGRQIYKAVGHPDDMGFSLVGGHSHCQFPSAQNPELTAFINKYLLGKSDSTANIEKSSATVDLTKYQDWTAPTLS